jgi:hypothetical protein
MKKIEKRFPIGSYVVMKDHQRKYSYYTSDELKVIGHDLNYYNHLLILDRNIGAKNTIHPDNVELSKRWLREKKIEFLFNI